MNWIEEHPYLTGSLVLVGIIAFFVLKSAAGSSSASTVSGTVSPTVAAGPSDAVQTAQLAASVQMQNSTNAATVANNQTSAQVAEAQIAANSAAVTAQLASNTSIQNTLTQASVSKDQDATQLAIAQVQTGGAVQLAGISAKQATDLATIGREENQDNINGNLSYATIEANKDMTLNAQNTNAAITQTAIQGNVAEYESGQQTKQAQIVANASEASTEANDNLQAYLGSLAAGVAVTQSNNEAGVENNYINTEGNVAITQSNNQTKVQQQQLTNEGNILNQVGTATVQNQRSSTGIAQIVAALFGTQQPTVQNSSFGVNIPGIGGFQVTNP